MAPEIEAPQLSSWLAPIENGFDPARSDLTLSPDRLTIRKA
jgi:hypothetical protein